MLTVKEVPGLYRIFFPVKVQALTISTLVVVPREWSIDKIIRKDLAVMLHQTIKMTTKTTCNNRGMFIFGCHFCGIRKNIRGCNKQNSDWDPWDNVKL